MSKETIGTRDSQFSEPRPVSRIRSFRKFILEKKTGKKKKFVYIPNKHNPK